MFRVVYIHKDYPCPKGFKSYKYYHKAIRSRFEYPFCESNIPYHYLSLPLDTDTLPNGKKVTYRNIIQYLNQKRKEHIIQQTLENL